MNQAESYSSRISEDKVMSAYELGFDEAVILQDTNVSMGHASVTLLLTNQNLIQVNKGLFGADRDAVKYPLLDLKELNGKPNVRIGKSRSGDTQLELYFQGYEKAYSFHGVFGERKWASAIEKAYRSAVSEAKKAEKSKLGVAGIFAPLKGTLDDAKTTFTARTKGLKTKAMKCPKCGAELVGMKGEQVRCSYCDAIVAIK